MAIRATVKGEKHYTATVLLVSMEMPQRVLLHFHKKLGKWMPPGGHQECLENSYEAALRETLEETGIDISELVPVPRVLDERALVLPAPAYILEERIDALGEQPEHFHLDMIYVVRVPMQATKPNEDESQQIGWFSKDELATLPMFENVELLLDEILVPQI